MKHWAQNGLKALYKRVRVVVAGDRCVVADPDLAWGAAGSVFKLCAPRFRGWFHCGWLLLLSLPLDTHHGNAAISDVQRFG